MSEAAYWDWPVRVGNNQPRIFRVPEGDGWANLTGAVMHLSIVWDGGRIDMNSADDAAIILLTQADAAERGMVAVTLSLAQTRDLPTDPALLAKYEIERRIEGTQNTDFYGLVVAEESINDD